MILSVVDKKTNLIIIQVARGERAARRKLREPDDRVNGNNG